MFRLERVKDDPDGATRRRLVTVKCRIDEEPAPRWLQIVADRAAGTVRIGQAPAFVPEDARPRDTHRDAVLAALGDVPLGERRIGEGVGLSKTTTRRILQDLESEGLALQTGDGWAVHRPHP